MFLCVLLLCASAVPGRRLWLLSFHNFISTWYAPLLFRPLAYLRGLRNLFGEDCTCCKFVAGHMMWHTKHVPAHAMQAMAILTRLKSCSWRCSLSMRFGGQPAQQIAT